MTNGAPPLPPNRGSFYTVVCGGTWLDRDKYNQAVADFKGDNLRYGDVKDALHFNTYRKAEDASLATQAFLQPPVLAAKPLLGALLSRFEPAAQALLAFLSKNLNPQPSNAQTATGLESQLPNAKREGLLAQMFNALLGNKREFQQQKVSKEEQEQRQATDFELTMPELFGLGRLQAPKGRSSMGGDGASDF